MESKITVRVEYTDTFNGEANYSWVRRAHFQLPLDLSDAGLMEKAKRLMGLEGILGETYDYGDMMQFTPDNMATTLFVTFD